MERQRGTFLTNDGVRLAYEYAGVGFGKANTGDSPIVLVHGWSGSMHYFDNSFSHILAGRNRPPMVVRYDLRGHGESEKPSFGYMIARFAADLRDLLDHLELDNVTLVGTSMGCAIIWSYLALFGEGRVKCGVFVDQAPLQNRAPDWELGSRGCYDIASLTRLQELLKYDYVGFAKGNARSCLSTEIDPAHRPARAFAQTILDRHHAGGPVERLLYPAGDDPDHSRMPAFGRGNDQRGAGVGLLFRLRHCRIQYRRFDFAPLGIVFVEANRDPRRFIPVDGGQQFNAQPGFSHPSARVDPRPE